MSRLFLFIPSPMSRTYFFQLILIVISGATGGYYDDYYKTQNLLRMGDPGSEEFVEKEGWTYEWTQPAHCPPATFITSYNFQYHKTNKSGETLQNIAVICSHLHQDDNNNGGPRNQNAMSQILHVGLTSAEEFEHGGSIDSSTEQLADPLQFKSCPGSYANGFISIATDSHAQNKTKSGETAETREQVYKRYALNCKDQPLKSNEILKTEKMKKKRGSRLNITVSKCTQHFALCGLAAKIARKSNGNRLEEHVIENEPAHIHYLNLYCCYVCSPEEKKLWVGSVETNEPHGRVTVEKSVRIGLEFRPELDPDNSVTNSNNVALLMHSKVSQVNADSSDRSLKRRSVDCSGNWDGSNDSSCSIGKLNTTSSKVTVKVQEQPDSIHFFYSQFGAKFVFPHMTLRTEKGADNRSVSGVNEMKIADASDNDQMSSKNSENPTSEYCFEVPVLRMPADKANDAFTRRIRSSKRYLRTIWKGAKVRVAVTTKSIVYTDR